MKVADFFKWYDILQENEKQIMEVKGREYTVSDQDKFRNFKSIAERLKLTPELVCMVYFLKHTDSITNYVLTGTESSDEKIIGRIMDARNYLALLGGLIEEKIAGLEK